MKLFRVAICLLGMSLVAGHWGVPAAQAKPVKSRSVKAAARLKNHPPAGWINHYLGDDRYKIAGHVWKVVSTQTDEYFHRPDCPEMLHQSADGVIGFPSVAGAMEAGYIPDPHCRPDINLAEVKAGAIARQSRQVKLADGRSTLTLPAGWKQLPTQFIRNASINATIEMFHSGSSNQDGAAVIVFDGLPGTSANALTAANVRQYLSARGSSGQINSALPNLSQDANVKDITFKGMRGILITPKNTARGANMMYAFQKGTRLHMIIASGRNSVSAAAKSLVNSYNPR